VILIAVYLFNNLLIDVLKVYAQLYNKLSTHMRHHIDYNITIHNNQTRLWWINSYYANDKALSRFLLKQRTWKRTKQENAKNFMLSSITLISIKINPKSLH